MTEEKTRTADRLPSLDEEQLRQVRGGVDEGDLVPVDDDGLKNTALPRGGGDIYG